MILRIGWSILLTVNRPLSGIAILNERILSIAVPHITAFLPPAFSAILPPIVDAHELVGSVAKTRFSFAAKAIASPVTTPDSTLRIATSLLCSDKCGMLRVRIG